MCIRDSLYDTLSSLKDKIAATGLFSRTPDKKTLIGIFIAVILAIAIVSGVLVADEMREGGGEISTQPTETSDEAVTSASEIQHIKSKFLLMLGDEEKIQLLSVVGLDSENEKVRIAFIDPESVCYSNNATVSFEEHFRRGGIIELVSAVSSFADIKIDGYLYGDEDNFTSLMKNMGDFSVVIDEEISYEHKGVSYIIESGQQELIPDMALKYFLYLCDTQPASYLKLANIMMSLGEKLFSVDDTTLENSINTFICSFNTDVSAVDFQRHKQAVKILAQKRVIDNMIIEGEAYHLGETTIN